MASKDEERKADHEPRREGKTNDRELKYNVVDEELVQYDDDEDLVHHDSTDKGLEYDDEALEQHDGDDDDLVQYDSADEGLEYDDEALEQHDDDAEQQTAEERSGHEEAAVIRARHVRHEEEERQRRSVYRKGGAEPDTARDEIHNTSRLIKTTWYLASHALLLTAWLVMAFLNQMLTYIRKKKIGEGSKAKSLL